MITWGSGARDQQAWRGLAIGAVWTTCLVTAVATGPANIHIRCGGADVLLFHVGGQSLVDLPAGGAEALTVKGGSDVG